MQAPVGPLLTVTLGIFLTFFAVEKLTLLYEEYVMQSIILGKDMKLLADCQTAEGYANLNHHPNLCENILARARVGAFWHALNRVAGSLPVREAIEKVENASWKILALLAVALLVVPSVFIKQSRARQEVIPYFAKCAP